MSSTDSEAVDADAVDDAPSAATPELIVIAVVAILAGVVARFVTRSALWLDEALSVDIASLPLSELRAALEHDGHPPLYYVLLHGWMELFGTGDVAVRALSGAFGLVTLVLVWFLGRRRGGTTLAWILVTLVAVSPFAVRYSNEARMYSLVMLLVVVGWFLLDDIVVRGRATIGRFIGVAVVTAALLYTHYWAMWLLAAVGLCALWSVWRHPAARRAWFGTILALVAGGVAFLPWLPSMLYQNAHTGTPWALPTRPTVALANSLVDYGAGRFGEQALVGIVLAIAIALGLFGAARSRISIDLDLRTRPQVRREAIVVALTFAIGTGLAYLTRSAFATRYSSVVFILVMVLAAAGLTRFSDRWIRCGVVVVVAGALAISGLSNITYERSQSKVIGQMLTAKLGPSDVVVVCPDQLGPALLRRIPDGTVVVTYPDGGDGRFVDWVDYAERNAASDPDAFANAVLAKAGPSGTVWLVWSVSYRTLEQKCADLNAVLSAARPAQPLIAENGDQWYEHASLTRFAPPT